MDCIRDKPAAVAEGGVGEAAFCLLLVCLPEPWLQLLSIDTRLGLSEKGVEGREAEVRPRETCRHGGAWCARILSVYQIKSSASATDQLD